MLHAVDFISLETFEGLVSAPDIAVLSIGDPDAPAPANLDRFPWYSRLEFLDVDPRSAELRDPQMACLPWQIDEIIDFVGRIGLDPSDWRLVVHCTYGSSRSAAAALIAQALTRCNMPRKAEAYGANEWMVSMARAQLGWELFIPTKPEPDTYVYLSSRLQI